MKTLPGEGTTTSARRLCRGALAVDRPEHASALRAGPDSVLGAMTKPLLIDEWQLAPEVLGAVKRAVDDESQCARKTEHQADSEARRTGQANEQSDSEGDRAAVTRPHIVREGSRSYTTDAVRMRTV